MATSAQSSPPHGRLLGHWARIAVPGLGALALVLAFLGVLYQLIGTWSDARRFPQLGRSVQAGTVKLNIDCSGERSDSSNPEVILDSGMGTPAIGWVAVQPEVTKFARVCSYDRAGYGWSESGPEPRTSLQAAKELKELLDAAGETSPYILVGHSLGGFNVRLFTKLYPAHVSGIVLVDASHEDEDKRINELLPPDVVKQEERSDVWNARLNQVLSPLRFYLGFDRLQLAIGRSPFYELLAAHGFSNGYCEELFYLTEQKKSRDAVMSELNAISESIDQVRAAGNFGDRPLTVLTAGKPYLPDPLLTKEQLNRRDDLWINVLQAQEAHLSTRGKQIIVADSGHEIPFERPNAIVSAIRDIYEVLLGRQI